MTSIRERENGSLPEAPDRESIPKTLQPEDWVDEHGDALFRYALLQLRNRDLAEDMVQETFVSAWQSRSTISGRSSERTWLTGILKHKIIDFYRKQYAEIPATDLSSEEEEGDPFSKLFDRWAHWRQKPKSWPNPRVAMEEKDFWKVLDHCISSLPKKLSNAFVLRVVKEVPTEESCNILNVSATNLGVILHRARIHLRDCMEKNWFLHPKRK